MTNDINEEWISLWQYHLGVRFVSLSPERKSELQDWVSRMLEEMLPEFVARQFQKEETFSTTILAEGKRDSSAVNRI